MKYLLFPLLLLITLQVRTATINISTIANPIPFNNVGFLSVGYNIQYGNPFPMARGIDPGFKTARIFNFDYSQSDTTYDLRYIVPQGVHLFKEVSCNLDFESEMISSQSDYQRTLAATLSVSGSTRLPFGIQAAFRASAEAKSVYKGMESSSLTYIINTGECRTFRAHISESHPPPLHQAFVDDVRSLLGPNSPTKDYFRFISIYGTHYIKELVMGSRMTFINTITESTRKSWTESNQKYSLSASARYASVAEVSASGMFEEQISAAREFNTKVSSSSVSTIGSTPAPDGDLNTWAAQSTADPMPIQYALEPLSELFTPTFFANTDLDLSTIKTMKLGLDKALRDYCYELLSQGEVDRCDTPSSSPYNQTSFVDMNNDGNLDLVCDTTDGYHEVLINQKDGSVNHSTYSDGPLNFLRSGVLRSWCDRLNGAENELTWVDFNGDNLKDAICDTARGTHHVMLNQGNDRFLPVGGSSDMLYDGEVPFVEYCVRTADGKDQPFWLDFNGDGLADLICNIHTGDVTVALNQGTFSMISIRNNTGGYWLTPLTESGILTGFCLSKAQDKSEAIWLDFNKDGYVDLICNGYKGDVSIYTNYQGNGILRPIHEMNATLYLADKDGNLLGDVCTRDIIRPSIPSWGNFDGDNYLEFYCSDANGYHMVFSYDSGIMMKRIFTHGPWWCFRSLLDFNIPLFMDMNNDSYDDLVCLDTNGGLTIVFNDGIGGYSQANGVLQIDDNTTKQIDGFCQRKGLTKNNIIRLMDYDGNGFPDLVCSTTDEQHLVLLNTNGTNFKTLGGTATGAINSVVTGEPLTGWCSPK